MPNMLTQKLELFGPLSKDDKRLLDDVVRRSRTVPANTGIIREGDVPTDVHLVVSGMACRCKYIGDGSRQIFAYMVAGDFCDLHVFILKEMDHTIETLSECEMVEIPRARVLELTERPQIARALWWANLVDEATLREWLVNLGQRSARERIAHLFCEIHLRLSSVGLAHDKEVILPVTQVELGDTMGLSAVHVNRTLQELRSEGLIHFESGVLTIPAINRLQQVCGFNPNYLHLTGGKKDSSAFAT